ncbi:alpha/beta hydrolase family protein [Nocardia mexicana]|uniref:Platelet-activating factor acetylhydrolase isoform II n=1 Tax=Nocardia mexicana TaxID=279262 RepID=A0A370H9K0_9NOCA|nr:alpha/beta hydrolase [Nocardia mexicana]RDI53348.1 platelet-activating factor acetylhydrolase isoform II [Nocardia mexicana]
MRFTRFHASAAVLAATLCLATAPVTSAAPGFDPGSALPAPTGPFPVGVQEFHLIDDRPDPWVPELSRELMVSAWYPAIAPIGRPDGYATPRESALQISSLRLEDVAPEAFSMIRTHAFVDAPRWGNPLPTVVLSPGFAMPRASLTGLAEELAARGYLVLGIDHTYETAAVTFPDGRVTECVACRGRPDFAAISVGRARDVSFVLDELTSRLPIDPARIAMGGHSAGGFAAPYALAEDPRIRAGFNLDGTFPAVPHGRAVDRPFLMMGAPHHAPEGEYGAKWTAAYDTFAGWKRRISVDGASHSSFTDYAPIGTALGVEIPDTTIDGRRAMELTRRDVTAFLDEHLRNLPQPVIDAASPPDPEVHFG